MMKNYFRKICCVLMCFLLLFLFGCSKNPSPVSVPDIETVSFEAAINEMGFDFNSSFIEVSISDDEICYFNSHNQVFFLQLTYFLANTELQLIDEEESSPENFYVTLNNSNGQFAGFSVYENSVDVWERSDCKTYRCDGVLKKFQKFFDTYLKQNRKYCRVAPTPISYQMEYAVYDKNGNTLEFDSISKTPHVFYNSGIVHFYMQTGTGTLTRYAKFFDVENGLISPEYFGQTDCFGNLVCATDHSRVLVYDMFSGEQLYCFDDFEKPLCDGTENIGFTHFSKDGKQLIVKYLSENLDMETQTFNLEK